MGNKQPAGYSSTSCKEESNGKKHNKSLRGTESLTSSLRNSVLNVGMTEIEKSVAVQSPICLKNNPISKKRPSPGTVKDKLHKA